jgi:hypothetical protein
MLDLEDFPVLLTYEDRGSIKTVWAYGDRVQVRDNPHATSVQQQVERPLQDNGLGHVYEAVSQVCQFSLFLGMALGRVNHA